MKTSQMPMFLNFAARVWGLRWYTHTYTPWCPMLMPRKCLGAAAGDCTGNVFIQLIRMCRLNLPIQRPFMIYTYFYERHPVKAANLVANGGNATYGVQCVAPSICAEPTEPVSHASAIGVGKQLWHATKMTSPRNSHKPKRIRRLLGMSR